MQTAKGKLTFSHAGSFRIVESIQAFMHF